MRLLRKGGCARHRAESRPADRDRDTHTHTHPAMALSRACPTPFQMSHTPAVRIRRGACADRRAKPRRTATIGGSGHR
ncbi:hypothetical protein BJX66DRAFT_193349 [Aspergillus keveii]|uniref:Uncharacterized protein n=1 Tax=Aspergillus keveii TaxID=714993 RepID=A0ABR4G6G2_9EURO